MKKNQNGYTLIEMLIVIVIIGLILPAVFTILITILQQQLQIYRITEVKRQGDYVLSYMKNSITSEVVRVSSNNSALQEECKDVGSTYGPLAQPFYFMDNQNHYFAFVQNVLAGGMLMQVNDSGSPKSLTSSKVKITNLQFSCFKQSAASGALVQISYTVQYNNQNPNPRPEEQASLNYQTKVRLKSF